MGVLEKVASIINESLNVDFEDIRLESRLQEDLGAESIDFLDIVFRLEQMFNIKIPRNEIFPEAIFQGNPLYIRDGFVTYFGLEELQEKLPFADLREFAKNPRIDFMSHLFTVGFIVRYIEKKLEKKSCI